MSGDDYDPFPGERYDEASGAAADERVREACAGERSAVVAWLLRCAKGHTKHAMALRSDAGTQADAEARGYERIASVLTDTARAVGEGAHWR
jgi:hypothetical protein